MKAATSGKIVQVSGDAGIWVKHGNEQMYNGAVEKAIEFYNLALEANPDLAPAWTGKADALEVCGSYDEAIQCYDHALACDPLDAECLFKKGITLREMGREEEGLSAMKRSVHASIGV
ncbi:MAG: tetratricopeptide repeat protein [Methanoregulaceae archaeon]|nr:tetratricopeptide repeat protein [Methanoregulaceae archaeon]